MSLKLNLLILCLFLFNVVSSDKYCDSCKAILYSIKSGMDCIDACENSNLRNEIPCSELCEYFNGFIRQKVELPCNSVGLCKDKEEPKVIEIARVDEMRNEVVISAIHEDMDNLKHDVDLRINMIDRKIDTVIDFIEKTVGGSKANYGREPVVSDFYGTHQHNPNDEYPPKEREGKRENGSKGGNINQVDVRPVKKKRKISLDEAHTTAFILCGVTFVVKLLLLKNFFEDLKMISYFEFIENIIITLGSVVLIALEAESVTSNIFIYARGIAFGYYSVQTYYFFHKKLDGNLSRIHFCKLLIMTLTSISFWHDMLFGVVLFVTAIETPVHYLYREVQTHSQQTKEFVLLSLQTGILSASFLTYVHDLTEIQFILFILHVICFFSDMYLRFIKPIEPFGTISPRNPAMGGSFNRMPESFSSPGTPSSRYWN